MEGSSHETNLREAFFRGETDDGNGRFPVNGLKIGPTITAHSNNSTEEKAAKEHHHLLSGKTSTAQACQSQFCC